LTPLKAPCSRRLKMARISSERERSSSSAGSKFHANGTALQVGISSRDSRALDDAKQVDVYLAAGMLQGASVVALETLDLALWRSIKPRLASLAGIEGAGRQRAFFLQSGAMLWLLEGDTGHAWQSLSDAEHAATSPVQRAAIALDRAFLARITGDRFSREQHLERAYQDLKREKWAVRTIEERMGLLDFVREASVDPRKPCARGVDAILLLARAQRMGRFRPGGTHALQPQNTTPAAGFRSHSGTPRRRGANFAQRSRRTVASVTACAKR
jgi:hypothetical protein